MNFIFVMDISLSVILFGINLWHWALTMTGLTSVEIICGGKVRMNINDSRLFRDYSHHLYVDKD